MLLREHASFFQEFHLVDLGSRLVPTVRVIVLQCPWHHRTFVSFTLLVICGNFLTGILPRRMRRPEYQAISRIYHRC